MTTYIKTYSEITKFCTFHERFKYLSLSRNVGDITFGGYRTLNQNFYTSRLWKSIRERVIIRDGACDLACPNREMYKNIIVHHMNPITVYDLLNQSPFLVDPEYLICTSFDTHNAIHYNHEDNLVEPFVERTPGDTCLWKEKTNG